MKHLKNKLYSKFGITSDRTKNITKHVLLSFLYKGGSILSALLMVPLTIHYLDVENYGVWLTLSSFIAWFSFFDIGLGNGLRNKFAVAKANGDIELAKAYVSTAYFTIGATSGVLILMFFILNTFVNWSRVFNSSTSIQHDLSILMPIVFGFFCLRLVAKLITTIYTADQHHSMQGKVNFYIQVGSLLLIWLMTKTSHSSLLLFGSIFSVFPVLILLLMNIVGFNNRFKEYRPTFSLWKTKYFKDIFGLGIKFFIIQISWMVITSTDNFIITQLYTPKEVVPYNIAFKYFSIALMSFTIIVTPFWSSFTEAFEKKEFQWIKKSMNNLFRLILVFITISFILLLSSNYIYKFWIGEQVQIQFSLSLLMCIYISMIIYLTPFNYFINGIGKIKLQLIQTLLMAVINIPLSYFLSIKLEMGVNGIILGTIFSVLPSLFLSTIQFLLITNNKAKGIWNK
mgnify:CR=1 FL=1